VFFGNKDVMNNFKSFDILGDYFLMLVKVEIFFKPDCVQIVYPKMKMLSSFTHHQVISYP